jgi:hypothetical protein
MNMVAASITRIVTATTILNSRQLA